MTHTPKMSGPRTNAFSSARSITWYIYLFKSIKYWMRKLTPKSPTWNGIFEETWYKLTINTLSHVGSVRGMWRVYILNFCTMGRAQGAPQVCKGGRTYMGVGLRVKHARPWAWACCIYIIFGQKSFKFLGRVRPNPFCNWVIRWLFIIKIHCIWTGCLDATVRVCLFGNKYTYSKQVHDYSKQVRVYSE